MKKSVLYIKLCLFVIVLCGGINTSAQISLVKSITCHGLKDGQLQVQPRFGTAPYTFLWSTGSTDSIVKGLGAGTYTVTVTDNVPITKTYTYVLGEPALISNTFTTINNSSWPSTNGSIAITTTGGNGGFSYSVKDSISRVINATLSGLASGTYFIKTTDTEGCYKNDTVRIGESAGYKLLGGKDFAPGIQDTTACYKAQSSTSIKPETTTSVTFPVSVYFDRKLFKTLYGFTKTNDSTSMYTNATTSVNVYGLNSNNITNGGNSVYIDSVMTITSGAHAGKDSVRVITSVSKSFDPGFHIMEVYTSDGKGFRYSWTVDSVTAPVSINFTQTNNTCYGDKNGTLIAVAKGSYADSKKPFTYTISGPTGFTSVANFWASALGAGIYTITATDWTGCTGSQSVTITQPDEPMSITFNITKAAKCPYSLDGDIEVHTVNNSVPPLTYLWSNGETTKSLTDVQSGTYSVTVTDANKCTVTDSTSLSYTQKSCFYNIVTPNGDGYNDYFDLTDVCGNGVKMIAKVFNEKGSLVASLDENNPKWDAKDSSRPPTGTSSTYTAFVELIKNGVTTAKFAESFSVIYSK